MAATSRTYISEYISTTIDFDATTTAPTKADSPDVDKLYYRRNGDSLEMHGSYNHSSATGAAAGSGMYLITIPNGLVVDSVKVDVGSAGLGIIGIFDIVLVAPAKGFMYINSTTKLSAHTVNQTNNYTWNNANYPFTSATCKITFSVKIPIVGWDAY